MMKKVLNALVNIRKNAAYYYGDKPSSILKYMFYSVFRVNTFLVFENDFAKPVPIYEFDDGFKPLVPSLEELETLRKGRELPREFYCDKTHNAKMCFLALQQDEPAYIHWVFFKGNNSRFLKLSEETAEINYATTLLQFRGRRISGRMFAFSTLHLQKLGYKKVVMVCHEQNPPIIKSFLQAGFREIRRIKAIGPLNRKILV
jgi:hypothetical protein